MATVKELPQLTKIKIMFSKDGHYCIHSVSNGDTLDRSFNSIKEAVAFAVGAFLVPINSK